MSGGTPGCWRHPPYPTLSQEKPSPCPQNPIIESCRLLGRWAWCMGWAAGLGAPSCGAAVPRPGTEHPLQNHPGPRPCWRLRPPPSSLPAGCAQPPSVSGVSQPPKITPWVLVLRELPPGCGSFSRRGRSSTVEGSWGPRALLTALLGRNPSGRRPGVCSLLLDRLAAGHSQRGLGGSEVATEGTTRFCSWRSRRGAQRANASRAVVPHLKFSQSLRNVHKHQKARRSFQLHSSVVNSCSHPCLARVCYLGWVEQ